MKRYSIWVLLAISLGFTNIWAQSTSLLKPTVQLRSLALHTDNDADLSDYYAWGSSLAVGLETKAWHGFNLGLLGSATFRHRASDLTVTDPTTHAANRYEVRLFDVTNPGAAELVRLENLYVRYQKKQKLRLTLGRQFIQTPFLNPQDGYLRPNAFGGLWLSHMLNNTQKLEGGWITKVLPRSTGVWHTLAESMGLYSVGVNPNGTKSGYAGNTETKGAALLNWTAQFGKSTQVQVWNTWMENIANTVFAQIEWKSLPAKPSKNKAKSYFAGLQAVWQKQVGNGGAANAAQAYYPNTQTGMLSAKAGLKVKNLETSVAGTRISDQGRFLMPREWGREPFYTFMMRERNEGLGDVWAAKIQAVWKKDAFKADLALGAFALPAPNLPVLNKYAMPSYRQMNAQLEYTPFKGMKLTGRFIRKVHHTSETLKDPKWIFNKVDMSLFELGATWDLEG